MKRYLSLFIVFTFSLTASIILSSSLETGFYQYDDGSYHLPDDVYDLVADSASPYAVDSSATRYRWYDGSWWIKYGNLAGWGKVSEFYLTDYLDSIGVVTTADLSGINTNLGFPYSYDDFLNGRTSKFSYNFTNLASALGFILNHLTYNQVAFGGDYLNSSGLKATSAAFNNAPFFLQNGFLGLASYLGLGDTSYSSLNSSGYSYTSGDSNYLKSLVRGQIGLASLLGAGNVSGVNSGKPYLQSTVEYLEDINNSLMGGNTLTPDNWYPVGYPGMDPGVPRSSLAQYLGDYLSAINRGVVSFGYDWLGSDGIIQPNQSQLNLSLADISAQGFMGLASILRGSNDPSGVIPWTYTKVDYTDLSTEDLEINSIIEALLVPLQDLQNDFAYYLFSHGTDLDIKMRENMQEQADAFVEDFTSSSGKGTPSAGNINDTAGLSGSIKDSFSSSATAADAMGQLTNSDNYSFLSTQTQQELNPFYNSRSRSSDDIEDFITPKLEEIRNGIGALW